VSAPTHEQFREIGFTGEAAQYPLSEAAYQWLRWFNGVPDGYEVPDTWRYAPNAYMQEYLERKAREDVLD